MNQFGKITIPKGLLPGDGRFGSGPARVQGRFVDDLAQVGATYLGTSHRRPVVRSVVRSIREGIATLYGLPEGYEVTLGIGGATAFWDAAAFCLIERRSAHFVCGEFSEKFASVTRGADHLEDPVVFSSPYGFAPEPRQVEDVDSVAYIHNETSTGVTAPFARLGEPLVLVDGTSAAGAIAFDIESVDAYYFSPQKALGSEGGLWLSIMSGDAIDRIGLIEASTRWIPPFLSLWTAVENSRKDQTYNTPALATLFLLDRQISTTLSAGGIEVVGSRSRDSSQHVYRWAETRPYTSPFVKDPSLRSPTVVTVDLEASVPAADVADVLRRHGIVDIDGYRKLGRNQLRIATFPNIPKSDVEALTACIDFVVESM